MTPRAAPPKPMSPPHLTPPVARPTRLVLGPESLVDRRGWPIAPRPVRRPIPRPPGPIPHSAKDASAFGPVAERRPAASLRPPPSPDRARTIPPDGGAVDVRRIGKE